MREWCRYCGRELRIGRTGDSWFWYHLILIGSRESKNGGESMIRVHEYSLPCREWTLFYKACGSLNTGGIDGFCLDCNSPDIGEREIPPGTAYVWQEERVESRTQN